MHNITFKIQILEGDVTGDSNKTDTLQTSTPLKVTIPRKTYSKVAANLIEKVTKMLAMIKINLSSHMKILTYYLSIG
jgi:hypothetical protein